MEYAADPMRAEIDRKIAYFQQQAELTDEQILKAYCESQRGQAGASLKMLLEGKARDEEIRAYIKKYGTDEG